VFEMSIIEMFTANPELKEWQGYRSKGEEKVSCISKMILTPIKNLADNADDISMGRFDTHIETTGGDEIGKLAKTFARMKISIKMVVDHLAK
jgi:methyl-accepting chemotaxis protein